MSARWPNFVTCHSHPQSLDSASSPKEFMEREQELETGAMCVTDHGSLNVCRQVYDMCKGKKVTPILGIEAYVRDDNDPILRAGGIQQDVRYINPVTGTFISVEKYQAMKPEERQQYVQQLGYWNYLKYSHLTLHALDQEAYETMVRLLSRAELTRRERHGSEFKPILTWEDIQELGGKNVTCGSGCMTGPVQQHVWQTQRLDLAAAYYERLRGTFKAGNFYAEVSPHRCDRYWQSSVEVVFSDQTRESFPAWKNIHTDAADKIKAVDLAKEFTKSKNAHRQFLGVMVNRAMQERPPKEMVSVKAIEGFFPNECTPWCPDGDVQAPANMFILHLARQHQDPVFIGDDSHYAHAEDSVLQDVRLLASGGSWRFNPGYHRQTSDEAYELFRQTLGTEEKEFAQWVENSQAWASRFKDFKFKDRISLPTKFYPADTLMHLKELIDARGRMKWDDADYVKRLQSEIQLLHFNGTMDMLPYFFCSEESVSFMESIGKLPGPGRGSAAGMLICYLLGITHAHPLKYGLSQDRFMTLDRIQMKKLPDIDQDFPTREPLVDPVNGWLKKRFGNCVAQVSVDTKLKLRSAVKDVARYTYKYVPEEIEKLCAGFMKAPQGIDDYDFVVGYIAADGTEVKGVLNEKDLKASEDKKLALYVQKYPQQWDLAKRSLGLVRQRGRHASAYVICNEPVSNFIPLTIVSDVVVTAYTAASVEAVGGIKQDYLVVNQLNDLGDCLKLIQADVDGHDCRRCQESLPWRCSEHQLGGLKLGDTLDINGEKVPLMRVLPYYGKLYDVWKLPEEVAVFRDICEGKTESVFQLNTPGAKQWLRKFEPKAGALSLKNLDDLQVFILGLKTIEDISAFNALNRPGPLDAYVTKEGIELPEGRGKVSHFEPGIQAPRALRPPPPVDEDGIKRYNMLEEYARRQKGEEPIGALPILMELLPETKGVMVYQEQLQRVFQELGGTTGIEANNFRIHVSKKQPMKIAEDKLVFLKGAVPKLGTEIAESLWQQMETFGQYGFNKSHSVCYSLIGYACAFLKHYYPQHWWAAVLSNATKDEISNKFWAYCRHLVDMPDVNLSGDRFQIHGKRIRAPISMLQGIGEKAHAQLLAGRPYVDIKDFCEKIQAYRVANATTALKEVVDKKTLQKSFVNKTKLAVSALNRRVVATLIIGGALDSLFPAESTLVDKLTAFETELQVATKKKIPAKDSWAAKFTDLTPINRYQIRKTVLPIYSESLMEILAATSYPGISQPGPGVYYFRPPGGRDFDSLRFITHAELEDLLSGEESEEQRFLRDLTTKQELVAAAYVKESRVFTYKGTRKAHELILDVDGCEAKFVAWGGEKGLAPQLLKNLQGCVVLVKLLRFPGGTDFTVTDAIVIAEKLSFDSSEESKD